MGRYRAYPEYKDSGVEWLGNIPSDWDMWKIAHACPYVASGTTPKSDSDFYYIGGENLWVTTGELRENIVTDTQKKVTNQALIDMPTLRLHPKGSVAIAMYGATIGRLGIFGSRATTNQACCVMPPSKVLHNKYLFYWLYAIRQEIINLSSGGGQPNVNQEKIASLKVSSPNFNTQSLIANFLDHETAKIDTLIEKQQQLIKLLKEKRQAVISHSVTKGLTNLPGANLNSSTAAGPKGEGRDSPSNPDAPMRDSGVEWLGEVPAHWVVTRAKFISHIFVPQRNKPELNDSFGVAWATMEDMKGIYIKNTKKFVSKEASKVAGSKKLKAGSVIASCVGNFGVSSINKIDVIINQQLQAFIPKDIKPEYLREIVALSEAYFDLIGTAATLIYVNQQGFENLPVVVPPKDEQEDICAYVEMKSGKFDVLVEKSERAIGFLQERRTALISAAVTGKIDVRDWTALEQQNKEDAA